MLKWFKIVSDIFDNRKIKLIESMPLGDTMLVIWFKLLALAAKSNDNGNIMIAENIPYNFENLQKEFKKNKKIIEKTLNIFIEFNMIEVIENTYSIIGWNEYQSAVGIEKIREQTRDRVAKFRDKKKRKCNVTSNSEVTIVTPLELELDIEVETKERCINTSKEKLENSVTLSKTSRFVKPSVEEVRQYCLERNNGINAEQFVNAYEAKGWMIGKSPMKDWKAAVKTWENARKENIKQNSNIKNDPEWLQNWMATINERTQKL